MDTPADCRPQSGAENCLDDFDYAKVVLDATCDPTTIKLRL